VGVAVALVIAVSLVLAGLMGALGWLVAPRTADRSLLRAGPVRRFGRRQRARWLSVLCAIPAWPHLLDRVVLRSRRTATGVTPADVVWRDGPTVLLRFRGERGAAGRDRAGATVLVVHSLLTRPTILDLTRSRSLVGDLLQAGLDVFLLDWGEPDIGRRGRAQAARGLAEHVQTLRIAEQHVLVESGARQLHVIGYCLGATVCVIRATAFDTSRIASLALIAPLIDTSAAGGMRRVLTSRWLKPVLALDGDGCVPAAIVRESFHALRPQALRTLRRGLLLRVRRDREASEAYGALARWVWEHRRMPGALALDVVNLYRHNPLCTGAMALNGSPLDLQRIRVPVLVAVADRDHIVPPKSSLALGELPGLDVTVVRCPSGHVSMLSGSGARSHLWPALRDWLGARARAT
jgi:polyhydroxyalkanoate synthase